MSAQHQRCPACGRVYLTHYSGAMRRHRCLPSRPNFARTLLLRSGGTVTLNGQMNFARLDPRARGLVCWLLDQFDAYEQANLPPAVDAARENPPR